MIIGGALIKRVVVVCVLVIACFWAGGILTRQTSPVVTSEFIQNPAGITFAHAPTIAETPLGFITAWYGRAPGQNETIYVARLERNSRAWTAPITLTSVSDGEKPVQSWNPVLFQQKNGPLFLFYKTGKGPQHWRGMFTASFDGGKTWDAPRRLPDGILGPTKNKPIELNDGTILCPSSTESLDCWKLFIERIRPMGVNDFVLKENWSKIGPLNTCALRVIQPALLDFGAGKIALLARNLRSTPFFQSIMEARSSDNGLTWTTLTSSGLPNPNSGIDAVMLKDGRAVLVYNPSRFVRTPLAAAVTLDQGKRWIPCSKLETGYGEFSYPSVIQAGDGMIHVVYTWQRKTIKHAVINPALLPSFEK